MLISHIFLHTTLKIINRKTRYLKSHSKNYTEAEELFGKRLTYRILFICILHVYVICVKWHMLNLFLRLFFTWEPVAFYCVQITGVSSIC